MFCVQFAVLVSWIITWTDNMLWALWTCHQSINQLSYLSCLKHMSTFRGLPPLNLIINITLQGSSFPLCSHMFVWIRKNGHSSIYILYKHLLFRKFLLLVFLEARDFDYKCYSNLLMLSAGSNLQPHTNILSERARIFNNSPLSHLYEFIL